jgi:hypothetical protein
MKKKDLTGQSFGKLIVIKEVEPYYPSNYPQRARYRRWLCKCDCGNEKAILQTSLESGNTKSCGCGCEENRKRIMTKPGESKHKYSQETRLRKILTNMKMRCYNPHTKYFENYGGRGIRIGDEWLAKDGADAFCEWALNNGYADGLTIDRINNDGDYEPNNCRWVDRIAQMNNTRLTRYLTYEGKTQSVTLWAREKGMKPVTLISRLERGWNVEDALTKPIKTTNRIYKRKKESKEQYE